MRIMTVWVLFVCIFAIIGRSSADTLYSTNFATSAYESDFTKYGADRADYKHDFTGGRLWIDRGGSGDYFAGWYQLTPVTGLTNATIKSIVHLSANPSQAAYGYFGGVCARIQTGVANYSNGYYAVIGAEQAGSGGANLRFHIGRDVREPSPDGNAGDLGIQFKTGTYQILAATNYMLELCVTNTLITGKLFTEGGTLLETLSTNDSTYSSGSISFVGGTHSGGSEVYFDDFEVESDESGSGSSASGIIRGPYLQNGSSSSMIIRWKAENATTGTVEYGLTHAYGSSIASPSGTMHEVELTGLSTDTRYCYRATSDGASSSNDFRTFPSNRNPVRFAAFGDSRHHKGLYVRDRSIVLSGWAAESEPHFVLHNGDVVDDAEALGSAYWQYMFDDYADLIAGAPLYMAAGNHEYSGGVLSDGYLEEFTFPSNGPDSELIYSFDCGMLHVTVAHIHNVSPANNMTYYCPGSDQFTWITNDLATTDQPWKIFMVHNPAFSSGKYSPYGDTHFEQATNIVQYYVPELEKYGVNLFVNGHDHLYERSVKGEVTYLTLSMLDEYYNHNLPNPYSVTKQKHGAVRIGITNNLMYVTSAREVDGAAEVIESFVITNSSFSVSNGTIVYLQ